MFDTMITVVGNVVDDPQLRATPAGKAVASFRIASSSRRWDGQGFVDSKTLYLTVTCWQEMAHNVVTSVRKGQPVVVFGRVYTREYVKDEQKRLTVEMTAEAIGHNLARGSAEYTKATRSVGDTAMPVGDDAMTPDLADELPATDALGDITATNAAEAPF
jgi:single-strand DNA-binding protein